MAQTAEHHLHSRRQDSRERATLRCLSAGRGISSDGDVLGLHMCLGVRLAGHGDVRGDGGAVARAVAGAIARSAGAGLGGGGDNVRGSGGGDLGSGRRGNRDGSDGRSNDDGGLNGGLLAIILAVVLIVTLVITLILISGALLIITGILVIALILIGGALLIVSDSGSGGSRGLGGNLSGGRRGSNGSDGRSHNTGLSDSGDGSGSGSGGNGRGGGRSNGGRGRAGAGASRGAAANGEINARLVGLVDISSVPEPLQNTVTGGGALAAEVVGDGDAEGGVVGGHARVGGIVGELDQGRADDAVGAGLDNRDVGVAGVGSGNVDGEVDRLAGGVALDEVGVVGELETLAEPQVAGRGVEVAANNLQNALDIAVDVRGLLVVGLVTASSAEGIAGLAGRGGLDEAVGGDEGHDGGEGGKGLHFGGWGYKRISRVSLELGSFCFVEDLGWSLWDQMLGIESGWNEGSRSTK
ncbi:hypothetical protein BKA56DRAFT_40983 [Ilyonectria sp. MPI-CAGE-AT-0026]|nr:hypothetical protein BKA56DRAFT_40983 [Ilyonectria sp. MPI-CAGE-AT-0026]